MRSLVTNLIEDYRQQASYWAGSLFESVTHFSTDYKGKFGEELLFKIIKDDQVQISANLYQNCEIRYYLSEITIFLHLAISFFDTFIYAF